MKHNSIRAAIAVAALVANIVTTPRAASAAVPKACSLLTTANLQQLFPGTAVTPPNEIDPYDCSWAADLPNGNEYKVSISIRPDAYGRWTHETASSFKEKNPAYGHAISGVGMPAVYDVVNGVYMLKKGLILQVTVIGSMGAAATEPKEIEVAKFVAKKFTV